MNIGLINNNYKYTSQMEKLKPLNIDVFIFYDNTNIEGLLDGINEGDTAYITSYAFFNDDSWDAAKLKSKLDDKKVIMRSVLENTIGSDKPYCDMVFALWSGAYIMHELIREYREVS